MMVRLLPPARSGWPDRSFPPRPAPWLVITMLVVLGGWSAEQLTLALPVLLTVAVISLALTRIPQHG